MNTNFKNVAIHESTHEKARFISNMQDRSMASVIEELIDRLFDITVTFDKGFNVDFETCVSESQVLISVTGRNKLRNGSFEVSSRTSNKEVDKMVEMRLKKHDRT